MFKSLNRQSSVQMSSPHASSINTGEPNASYSKSERNDWTNNPTKHYIVQIGEYGGANPKFFDMYARSTIRKRKLPQENLFGEMVRNYESTIFNSPEKNSLMHLNSLSRLDVVIHGYRNFPIDVRVVNRINDEGKNVKARKGTLIPASVMAEKLVAMGLRQVGVLRLDSCNVGTGEYLYELRYALRALGVNVGYLAAPNGYLGVYHHPLTTLRPVYHWKFWDKHWTVIKGNLSVEFFGTRYTSLFCS
ncbi:hypothetical protein [Pantoea sp. SS70]|uniref:hypothetical protein n=1 Tax=Pantoea sp. SS70 TaxID=3024247 RepID=UPI0024535C78|nr:hypothetical protein [Pantoea sp. SS70]WGK60086.1 hypothetical protein PO881_23375 [Pantoea sp. SS70]